MHARQVHRTSDPELDHPAPQRAWVQTQR
jgi:hypothetical protein